MVSYYIPERSHWDLQNVCIIEFVYFLFFFVFSVSKDIFQRAVLVFWLHTLESPSLLIEEIFSLFKMKEIQALR